MAIIQNAKFKTFNSFKDFINSEVKQNEFNRVLKPFIKNLKNNYKNLKYKEQKKILFKVLKYSYFTEKELIEEFLKNRKGDYIILFIGDYSRVHSYFRISSESFNLNNDKGGTKENGNKLL